MRVGVREQHTRVRKKPAREYDPSLDQIAGEACATLGATAVHLARMLGVTVPTIYNWMRAHPTFYSSIKEGKDRYDTEHVESALLRRATGYDYQITEQKVTKDGDVVDVVRTIHIPPDPECLKFYLVNRQRARWQMPSSSTKVNQLILPGTNGAVAQQITSGEEVKDERTELDKFREIAETLRASGALNAAGAIDISVSGNGDRGVAEDFAASLK